MFHPCILPALLALHLSDGEQQTATATVELGAFAVTQDEGPEGLALLDPFAWLDNSRAGVEGEDLNPRDVLDLLDRFFGRGQRGLQARTVAEGSGAYSVKLEGTNEQIAQAREILGFLEEQLHAPRRFEVLAFRSAGVSPAVDSSGSVLSPEETEARIAAIAMSGTDVRRYTLSVRPGQTGTIHLREERSFVADYDVEIAAGAFAYDPRICMPRIGDLLVARAKGEGDGSRLSLVLRRGVAAGPVTSREMVIGGLAGREQGPVGPMNSKVVLEGLEIVTHSFGFETVLRNGESVELSIESALGDGAGSSYLVRALDVGPGPVRRLAVGDRELVLVEEEFASPDTFTFEQDGRAFADPEWSGALYAALPSSRGPAKEVMETDRDASRIGPFAFVVCGPTGPSADKLVDEIQRILPSPARHRVVNAEIRSDGVEFARFRFPCLAGSKGFAATSRGAMRVYDLDVEVAANASVVDPSVEPILEGALCIWDTRGRGSVELEAAVGKGPETTLTLEGIGHGMIDRTPRTRIADTRSLAGGEAELGVQGGPGLSAIVRLQ